MKQFCIITPIYKETPDPIEIISLQRLNNIIGNKNYDVYFVTHNELNIDKYISLYPNAKISYFDKYFFQNTATYSQLCMNYNLYSTYKEYEYLFIYQTDCYLLRDEFSLFCNGYDYIGAPVCSTDCGWPTVKTVNGVQQYSPIIGNGGFSVRKIETFLDITDPNGDFRKSVQLTDELIKELLWEDLFICVELPKFYDINIAPLKVGYEFAWDMSVDVIYNYFNITKFPMCIHAWDKNIRFWQDKLDELKDNQEVIDFCETKHKYFFTIYYGENNETIRKD